MITLAEARKAGKLPSGYTKLAEVTYQPKLQVWVTVARFHTQTLGQGDVFFTKQSGFPFREIGLNEYAHHVRSSVPNNS